MLYAWKWRGGKASLLKKDDIKGKVVLCQSESGKKIEIPLKDTSQAPKRLGVRIAGDGNWKK